jgi:hypothetical protein
MVAISDCIDLTPCRRGLVGNEDKANKKSWTKDLYERSIGNIVGGAINILIALGVYFFALPKMNEEQYMRTLLMSAITAAQHIEDTEKARNSNFVVYLHFEENRSSQSTGIRNSIYSLLTAYKFKTMAPSHDFLRDQHHPAVTYENADDRDAAERVAFLINLILPPAKGKPIEAEEIPPVNGDKGRQLGVWLPNSF